MIDDNLRVGFDVLYGIQCDRAKQDVAEIDSANEIVVLEIAVEVTDLQKLRQVFPGGGRHKAKGIRKVERL